jgi:hypothetical protein
MKLVPTAKAGIEQPLLSELLQIVLINASALALIETGSPLAAANIPIQPQPVEIFLYLGAESRLTAGRV